MNNPVEKEMKLSKEELKQLAEFFLILDEWDKKQQDKENEEQCKKKIMKKKYT